MYSITRTNQLVRIYVETNNNYVKKLKMGSIFFENNIKAHNFCFFNLTSQNSFKKIHFGTTIFNALQKVSDFMYFKKTISQKIS